MCPHKTTGVTTHVVQFSEKEKVLFQNRQPFLWISSWVLPERVHFDAGGISNSHPIGNLGIYAFDYPRAYFYAS